MKTQSSDTPPEIERLLIEGYRRMTAGEKLQRLHDMSELVWALQAAEVRRRLPQADEREVALRVASRSLGPELMRKAFGWDPEVEGY
jgi:hypothetical protein